MTGPKKPMLAAVANFILPGAGTLYVGRRKQVGLLMMVSAIFTIAFHVVFTVSIAPVITGVSWVAMVSTQVLQLCAAVAFSAALSLDAYHEARAVNANAPAPFSFAARAR